MTKKIIAVNQGNILSNKQKNTTLPVISVYDAEAEDLEWVDGNEVILYGQDGKEAARIVYRPNSPWRNRPHVWIETENDVEIKE